MSSYIHAPHFLHFSSNVSTSSRSLQFNLCHQTCTSTTLLSLPQLTHKNYPTAIAPSASSPTATAKLPHLSLLTNPAILYFYPKSVSFLSLLLEDHKGTHPLRSLLALRSALMLLLAKLLLEVEMAPFLSEDSFMGSDCFLDLRL